MDASPLGGTTSKATPEGPPTLKQQEIMPLHKMLVRSHQEVFSWDSSLVREMREEYFQSHCPNFNNENTCRFTDVFWHMIEITGLLGSDIYEIIEAWSGWDELQQAKYSLMTLPKGLKFFRVLSPSRSPKVIGLMGIHNPDMLCHFSGVTHCPWCRKVGQNEGTIINDLAESALQTGPHVWDVFWLPVCHVRGHLLPWPE